MKLLIEKFFESFNFVESCNYIYIVGVEKGKI